MTVYAWRTFHSSGMEITITVDNHIGDPDFATCTVDDLKTTITVEIKGNVEFPRKKRTREKRNAYNRAYRKLGKRHPTSASRASLVSRLGGKCERCESRNKIDLHHIRPLRFGGTNETRNLLLLCKPCHQLWHTRLDSSFWQQKKEV